MGGDLFELRQHRFVSNVQRTRKRGIRGESWKRRGKERAGKAKWSKSRLDSAAQCLMMWLMQQYILPYSVHIEFWCMYFWKLLLQRTSCLCSRAVLMANDGIVTTFTLVFLFLAVGFCHHKYDLTWDHHNYLHAFVFEFNGKLISHSRLLSQN